MASPARTAAPSADASDTRALAIRIGLSWRELRRGASTGPLRDFLYSTDGIDIELGTEQIDLGQVDTLDVMVQRDDWRMSELAEALRVEPSTATRAVQRLERSGLARRRPTADDGRGVVVAATDDGRTVHAVISARRSELFAHLLRSFDDDELPVLADMLEQFVGAVDGFVATHRR
ncbi:MAG: MarR family winged helix-turn-helix transcriptional regulator [Ilumatobacteraceae bacterium]|jgi:DNA-binding MarR family transcriptional regulator